MDPVIVVGGGPVGLALALALARHEVPSIVLDQGPAMSSGGPAGDGGGNDARTVVLRADAAAMLERLGCGDAVAEAARWTAWRTVRRRQELLRVEFGGRADGRAGTAPGGPREAAGGAERGAAVGAGGGGRPGVPAPRASDDPALPERLPAVRPVGAGPVPAKDAAPRRAGREAAEAAGEAPVLPAPIHLEQHRLLRSLAAAAAGSGLVRLVDDARLDALEQDPRGVTGHTGGGTATWWRGSFLVGCDGPRSTVRKLLGVRFPGRTAVDRHLVAVLRTGLPFPGEGLLHWDPPWRGESEVAARPLPHGAWRLDWRLPPHRDDAYPPDAPLAPDALVTRIRETLAGWCEGTVPPYDLLAAAEYRVHQRLARRWRHDRVFLAGAAAHQLGALGVQSVEEGLRDADNLAWKLALAWHGQASADLLDTYQAERRGAVGARLRAVDQALPLVRSSGALRAVRRSLSGSARRHAALLTDGHVGTGQLGGPSVYGRAPLSAATDTPVGGQVEDVPVTALDGTRTRLRARLGAGLLVVLVAPGTAVWESRHWLSAGLMPALIEAAEALPVPAEVLVAETYPGSTAHTVLLVRPDGHLAAAMHGCRPDELRAYAEGLRGGRAGTAGAEPTIPTSA